LPRLIWTPAALSDVSRLHAFLFPKSRESARRAVAAIRRSIEELASHPEIGRPVDDMPPEFREWFIRFGDSGYVGLYHYDGEQVTILAVRHGKEAGYF
jgi:plasmid stabilization system protein ParE